MPAPKLSYNEAVRTIKAVNAAITKRGGKKKHTADAFTLDAAKALGIAPRTLLNRLQKIAQSPSDYPGLKVGQEPPQLAGAVELPAFPDDDMPTAQLIDLMCSRFEKRLARAKAERWYRVGMPDNRPFGLILWGDPHLDSNGCNWPLVKEHAALAAKTDGLYSVNVGDLVDNWNGRLMRLYAESDTSKKAGWELVRWFFHGSGIKWITHVLGNHDQWGDGATIIRLLAGKHVPVMNDEAKFYVETPNGVRWPIWVRHNFEGHSMWNSLHGPQKAAKVKESAAIYVCGHLHNWALHEEESASRDFIYWLARARGYKWLDPHQVALGHDAQEYGASIVAICNPRAERLPQRLRCFPDVAEAAEFLTFLRRRKAA